MGNIHPPKVRVLHFNCTKNGVEIKTKQGNTFKRLGIAANLEEMKALVEKINLNDNSDVCMFSYSMDFPQEYTKNKKVLALCRKLRG